MKLDKDTLAWIGYIGGAFVITAGIFIFWIYLTIEATKWIDAAYK